jgi:hypothetical protein
MKPPFPKRITSPLKIYPFLAFLLITACAQPPESLALQCITGSAEWSPLVLDFANSRMGENPATITDSQIRWQTVTPNGFGGATHTQYGINRNSGMVTVDNIYVDPHGNRSIEPTNRYSGECYARHRPF